MNVRRFARQAGLYYIGLLALVVVVLDSPVRAQPLKPSNPSEQALRNAALDGQIETVRSRLDKGVSTDAPDPDGRTALMMAAFNGHTETVRLLLDRGAKNKCPGWGGTHRTDVRSRWALRSNGETSDRTRG